MAEIDPIQLQRLIESLDRASASIERLGGAASRTTKTMAKEGAKAAEDIKGAWVKALDPKDQEAAMAATMDVMRGGFHDLINELQGQWSDFTSTMGRMWQNKIATLRKPIQAEQRAMKTGLQRFKSSLLSELPFGGLFGLMLYGRLKEAEYRAYGQQAAQQFKAVGRVGSGVAGQLSGDIRTLLTRSIIDSHAEIVAMTGALAEAGVTAGEAMGDAEFRMQGFDKSVAITTIGLDKMFQVQSGTSAKLAGDLARDTNISIRESVTLVKNLGFAARESGMSFQMMLGSVMQTTSALRLQAVDAEKLGDLMMRIQQGFRSEGMTAARAGQIAAQAMPALAQAVTGMSTGMQAFIGQRVGQRMMGRELGAEEAMIRMQRGFRGAPGGGDFFGQALSEMMRMAEEAVGPDPFRQEFALQQMFGMTPEASQAMMAMQKDINSGMDVQEAAAKHADELNQAFRDQGLKTSDFEKWMKILRDALAQFGSGLMDLLVTGFQAIELSLKFIVAKLAVGLFTDLPPDFTNAVLAQGAFLASRTDAALNRMMDAGGEAFQALGGLTKATTGRMAVTKSFQNIMETLPTQAKGSTWQTRVGRQISQKYLPPGMSSVVGGAIGAGEWLFGPPTMDRPKGLGPNQRIVTNWRAEQKVVRTPSGAGTVEPGSSMGKTVY